MCCCCKIFGDWVCVCWFNVILFDRFERFDNDKFGVDNDCFRRGCIFNCLFNCDDVLV